MGRMKAFDRAQAIRIVMNEIWSKGYETCSVKSLSEVLGLTRSSFYNAFGSREELFLEVLQLYFNEAPDNELEEIDGKSSVLLSICKVFKNVCIIRAQDTNHRGCLAINSIVELIGNNEKFSPLLISALNKSSERFERLLNLAHKKGEMSGDQIRSKALALQNLLIGINVLSLAIHNSNELWESTKITLLGLDIYKHSFDL